MRKKFLSMLLVLALCLSLGVTAFASGGAEEGTMEEAAEAADPEEAPTGEEEDAEDTLPEEPAAAEDTEAGSLPEAVAAEEEDATEPVPVMEETSMLPAEEETEPEAGETPADAAEEPAEETEVQVLTAGIQQEEEVLEDTLVYVNPLYADVLTEADIQEAAAAIEAESSGIAPLNTVYYTNKEDAGAYLREQMTARQTTLTVSYTSSEYDPNIAVTFIQEASIHTGEPTEGDYLLYQLGGYTCGLTASLRSGLYYITFTYTMVYYSTAEQEAAVDAKVSEVLASLDLNGKSNYDKVCAIYDYICDNVTYDYAHLHDDTHLQQFTAYAALIEGTAVCQGYANLFYRMALECGIDARIVAGTSNGEAHAWNIVELDGVYYNLDATWDAGRSTYAYFLRCDANFIDHTRGIDVGGSMDYTSAAFYAQYPMSSEDYAVHGSGDHAWDAGTVTREPTCTATGVMTYTCTECGETYTERIEPSGHSYVVERTVDVEQCERDIIYVCEKCGDTYVDEEDVLGHDYTASITNPTCTSRGYMTYTCGRCGDSYQSFIEPMGHDYFEVIVSPTCTEQGYAVYTCSRCGDSYQDDFTDALGHTWNAGTVTKAPTTSAAGVRTYTCTVCGETYTEAIPALESSSDSADAADTGSSTPTESDDTSTSAGDEDGDEDTAAADEAESHTPGDINDDGTVNISDVQTLLKYVNGQSVSVDEYALDVNGDGTVNISDVQTLLKSVNGQSVTIY